MKSHKKLSGSYMSAPRSPSPVGPCLCSAALVGVEWGGSLTKTLTVGYEEGTGRSLRTSTYIYLKFQRIFNERKFVKFVTKVRHDNYKEFLLGIKRLRFKSLDPSSTLLLT